MRVLRREFWIDGRSFYGWWRWPMYVVVWVPTAIAAVTLMVGLVYLAERESCSDKAEVMGRDHRYGLFKGCMFEADSGEFVPEGQLRFNESGEVVE